MSFTSFLQTMFGNKSTRDIRAIQPLVETVKAAEAAIRALSHDELRAKTQEIRAYIQGTVAKEREQVAALKATIADTPLDEREAIFNNIDKIEKEILEKFEVVLNEVMPVVFSIVKDTARRFAENTEIIVRATAFDRELAANPANDFITIDGDNAIYHNSWTAGGNKITWDMVHYDVQIFGGIALHQGKIAEMATGEGKTLVATFPVFLNALTGNGVHVVTVNDYLSKRDSEWMGPIYMFNGLSVDCIDKHKPNSEARRRAYNADITFGTNNEFGFDYLRDNMAFSPEDLVQRKHNYAIVDEVDSVLIDDARTPLIISGPIPKGDDQMFEEYQPLVERLVNVQRTLATKYLADAKTKIAAAQKALDEGKKDESSRLFDEGFLSLFRSFKALPKNKALTKFLSEEGIKSGMLRTEEKYMANNNREMPKAIEPLFFVVDEKLNSCDLTDKGTAWLAHEVKDDKLFVLPDITTELSAFEADSSLSEEQRIEKKDEALAHYAVQSERVHTLHQLLKAYCMFNRDDEYVVIDGEVKIVDEQTGRIMEGRRWSDGLHQAVEAKEHVKVEAATQTFATITLQNYFRMYHKLAGMTGTAVTEAGELWDIYKLDVVEIPTNRPVIRKDMTDRVYKTNREKYRAVIQEIIAMRESGRPSLVGTTSVEISELLKRMLDQNHIPCQVLNAKLHQREADIVAQAGRSTIGTVMVDGQPVEKRLGTVTIATNMAGRGTDIKLTDEVKAAGGLAIIGTERHESRRVDRQLRGRSGRQGDPGSSVFYVSLEDKLMKLFGSDRISSIMDRLGFKEGEMIENKMISNQIEKAQKKVEENHFGTRKHLLEYDDVMNKQRTVIYEKRRHALMGERIGMDIANIIWDRVVHIINSNDYIGCREEFLKILAMECPFTEQEFISGKREELEENAFQLAMTHFTRRMEKIQEIAWPVLKRMYEDKGMVDERAAVPITDGRIVFNIRVSLQQTYEQEAKNVAWEFQRVILLHIIDDCWKENLRQLDELRHSVQNASYEQKDPLLIFKLESVTLFDDMVNNMNNRIAALLMRAAIPVRVVPQQRVREMAMEQRRPRYTESKASTDVSQQQYTTTSTQDVKQGGGMQQAAQQDTRGTAHQKTMPIVKEKQPGRNELCPCGSGKKFKNCHGRGL